MSSNRRTFLAVTGASVAATLTGCLGGDGGSSTTDGESGDGGSSDGGETSPESLSAPVMGDPNADVVLQSWEDFQCSHCQHFHLDILSKLESEYVEPGTLRVERHDFPIPLNELSWKVASAARSVQAQEGDPAFWTFADRAYERQSSIDVAGIREIASAVGADPDQVASDVESGTYRGVVEDDRQKGRQKGVSATPAIYVDGTEARNTYQDVKKAIENALA